MTALLVAVAGGLGAVARLLVDGLIKVRRPGIVPWQTAVINVTGSLLVGFAASAIGTGPHLDWHAVLAVGFCGGYTTMSTASVETVTLLRTGRSLTAFGYVGVSLVLSLTACAIGIWLGHRV
ncbi:fluoride efflux transporter FluC [Gordonia soli]|uniref:fluoride efflux transporter FluC n=1 Tax=Gordonia soli TaxID=320799 RepID=UPI00058C8ECD|nr:CrcB family protein [Gordonia soli]